MSASRPVLIMAGGTGGHVFPGLAVARVLEQQGVPVVWLGTRQGLEARVVPDAGIAVEWLLIRGLRNKGLTGWLLGPLRLFRAVLQAMSVLRRRQPLAVLGMGGYAAAPGGVAAWLLRRPLVIHEQNAVAGLTNRCLARLASRVLSAFPAAFPERFAVEVVGNPVRADILRLGETPARAPVRGRRLRVLVVGGSLGAQVLNRAVPAACASLEESVRPVIRHQAGERTLGLAREAYATHGVEAEVTPFIDDMAEAYSWADLVICRAGALTVSELAVAGVPAILVPLPHAVDDHQTANARHLADNDAGWLLPESELSPRRLAALLTGAIEQPEALAGMSTRARELGWRDSAERVARHCLEVA